MDEETKALLGSILTGKKKRFKEPDYDKIYDKIKGASVSASRTETEDKPSEEYGPFRFASYKPTNRDLANLDEVGICASTANETAILSINNAKACLVLRANFTRAALSELKTLRRDNNIEWNSKDSVMEIHPSLLPQVKLILKEHYKDVHVLGVQKQVKATKFDLLMNKLDKEDKQKIYVMLAKKYHTDLGGNKETMTLINLVFKSNA